MNRFKSMTKPLIWFMTLLLVAIVAGCLTGNTDSGSTASVTPALSSAKAVTTFSLGGYSGVVNESAKSIAVTVPFGSSVTALVATFTTSGVGVTVGIVSQTSGTTANDFTHPMSYIVIAADGTIATYTVTVTAAAANSKGITAFSFAGIAKGSITGASSPYAIAVTVPSVIALNPLTASFTTTGNSVTVVATGTQTTAITANNFTSPVAYTVHAADGSTAVYNVTVVVGAAPVDLLSIITNNFVILAKSMITDSPTSFITGNIGVSPAAGSTITVPCADMVSPSNVYDIASTYGSGSATCAVYNSGLVAPAVADMLTAYGNTAGLVSPVPSTELGAGNISGMTLLPGIYKWSTGVLIYAGNPNSIPGGDTTGVTLDCGGSSSAVFIFQIASPQTLTLGQVATPAHINLTGSCAASNIFWQVGGNVTIHPASVFYGNILTATQVAMEAGGVLHGRALAQTAVTLISNTVGP